MKKLKRFLSSIALLTTFMVTPVFAEGYDFQDRFTGEYKEDYAFHYGAGAVLGGAIYWLYPEDWNQTWRIPASIIIPIVFKGAMEIFDDCPSAWDALEYGAGAAISVTILKVTF